jgi:hypothetical protein
MGPIGCPEKPVTNYHYSLRDKSRGQFSKYYLLKSSKQLKYIFREEFCWSPAQPAKRRGVWGAQFESHYTRHNTGWVVSTYGSYSREHLFDSHPRGRLSWPSSLVLFLGSEKKWKNDLKKENYTALKFKFIIYKSQYFIEEVESG